MSYFPFFMRGEHLHGLLVGGGVIAAAKLETLAGAGATVTIVAPQFCPRILELARQHDCRMLQQSYEPALLEGCNLVIAATGDIATGERIAADARAAGIWVNVVDNPPLCDFIFPAIIQRGPLTIAISTGGASPVLARLLKQDFEQGLPEGVDHLLPFMQVHTCAVRAALPDVQRRRLFWERLIRGPIGRMLTKDDVPAATAWFQAALAHAEKMPAKRAFHFLAVESFDPDALTVRAVKLIGRADVVLYEREAMQTILERYARRDAEKMLVVTEKDALSQLQDTVSRELIVAYLGWQHRPDYEENRARLRHYASESGLDGNPA